MSENGLVAFEPFCPIILSADPPFSPAQLFADPGVARLGVAFEDLDLAGSPVLYDLYSSSGTGGGTARYTSIVWQSAVQVGGPGPLDAQMVMSADSKRIWLLYRSSEPQGTVGLAPGSLAPPAAIDLSNLSCDGT